MNAAMKEAMASAPPYRMGRAVVVGASLAGLLAASVLSKHFERVILIERDALPETIGPRRGIPQGRHVHVLLKRGQQVIEKLLPGFNDSLVMRGASQVNTGTQFRWHHFGCWKSPFETDRTTISVSRPALEHEVRRRVMHLPNVSIVSGAVFTRYAVDWEYSRITGVFARAHGPDTLEDLVRADLVIDASGRGSQTPRMLKELGYAPPPETAIRVNFGYASRIYERPASARDWQAMYVVDRAPRTRGGMIFPIEGNRWMVTLLGWHGDHPPASEAGFLEFARSLPAPDLHAAICGAQPLTDAVAHGFPATWRRHYEKLSRFPSGLVVMGDALCSFNPVYGQGMTVSALEAELLEDCLGHLQSHGVAGIEALTREFRTRVADVVEVPWQMASGEDLRFPQTVGERPAMLRFIHWYTAKLHRTAGMSPRVAERFNAVVNMIEPRSGLFRADVIREMLRFAWRPRPARSGATALAPESRYG
jgi:2-polyprenyl-6-methoxyphenol hydroxylase-like FAD-dependent oxidoreductase